MKVERLDHIHIAVRDLDKAVQFFSDILGTPASGFVCSDTPEFFIRSATTPQGLDLMQPLSPQSPITRFLERRGEGLWAISLKVPNLEEAIAELQAKGLTLAAKYEEGRLKQAVFHPKDTFGVMIELCEYAEEHGAAQAALGK